MPLPTDPLHPINREKTAQNPIEIFRDIPDPRKDRNVRHKLSDIFAIAISAILSGANDWVKVAKFGVKKEKWLRTFLELPNGIPSHDTFDRVFLLIDPDEFEKRFIEWTRLIADLLPGEVIAIDGGRISILWVELSLGGNCPLLYFSPYKWGTTSFVHRKIQDLKRFPSESPTHKMEMRP